MNRGRCTDCFDVKKPFKRIRRSYLQDYVHCPYNLYLNAVLGKVPPMGGAAQAGVILHDIIEKMQNGEMEWLETQDEFTERCEEWNKGLRKKSDLEFDYSLITDIKVHNGIDCLDNWYMNVRPKLNNRQFITEKNIRFSIGEESDIGCTLDRVEWDDDSKIHIHDWKTGKPLAGQQLVKNLQPGVYIYAVYKEFGEWAETFSLHYIHAPYKRITYYHQGNGVYEVRTTKNVYTLNVLDTIEKCREIIRHINAAEFPANAKLWYCEGMCWYNKTGDCVGTGIERKANPKSEATVS